LCQPFLQADQRPSQQLKQVSRLVAAAGLTQNPALALALHLISPWNLYFAYRMEQYKADLADLLPQWLEVWFELEALSSLAGLAYLNPNYAFPTISVDQAAPLFQAQQLGHPLLPRGAKVCNDFTLTAPGEVIILTGSNMSGKSSFLRTVGVNLRLAYAGGPVDAADCQVRLLRLFSCLNVSDSVTDGISYFYAEVKRLKALLKELEQDNGYPLCYLIDEIFRGTNNRERYLGSLAYIRTLVGQHGAGLIATHDLELVKLADEIARIKNYHFREDVVEGRMVFDYQLRPGPCPTTNALRIMALEGLPVATPEA
jgi:DNA mismatch repair ATPase MutS